MFERNILVRQGVGLFDNPSECESECRFEWVSVWVDTTVGVRKKQSEIDGYSSVASKMTIIVK